MNRKILLIITGSIIVIGTLAGTLIPLLIHPNDVSEKEPPIIRILNPYVFEVVSGTTEILFEAVDVGDNSSGIASYEILIDEVSVSSNYSYELDTTVYEDGTSLEIVVRAVDNAGNTAEKSIKIVVDNTLDSPRSEEFKVLVWNAWVSGTECTKLGLCDDWLSVLFEEDADIIIVSETGTFDNGRKMEVITNRLSGFFYYEAPYSGNATDALAHTDGVAVISRYPILEFHDIPEYKLDDNSTHVYHRSFCDAVIDIQGKVTHVIGYHGKCCSATPTSNTTLMREQEVEGIVNYMDDLGDVPIMFGGDFNQNSPDDTGDLASVADNLGTSSLKILLRPDDPVYGQYSSKIHNFTDTWRTMYPTERGWTYGFNDPQYWGRIDYLFVNQHWDDKMINGTTGDTPSAETTSDHYTVDCFFSLDSEYVFNETVPILYAFSSKNFIDIEVDILDDSTLLVVSCLILFVIPLLNKKEEI